MSFPFLSLPLFSYPSAPGGQLSSFYAGGSVQAPTYNNAGLVNTNPVILDADGNAVVRRDPSISYGWVLKDSTGTTTLWSLDNDPSQELFGQPVTLAAASTVDLGSAGSHSALIHGAGATISSFGNSASTGTPYYLGSFDGANIIAGSVNLVLPGSIPSINTVAGDAFLARYTGVGWKVEIYQQGFVSASGGGGLSDSTLVKSSDQTIVSNNNPFIDTDLSTPALPIGWYEYELLCGFGSNNSTNGGAQFFLKQAGAVIQGPVAIIYNVHSSFSSAGDTSGGTGVAFATLTDETTAFSPDDYVWMRGAFQVTVAGPLQLYWAQNTSSSAYTKLRKGSFLKIRSATPA